MRIVLIAFSGFEKKHAAKEGNEYESILEAHCSHFSKYRFSVDENRVLLSLVAGSQTPPFLVRRPTSLPVSPIVR